MFYLVRLTPNIHNASYHYVCSRHKNNTYIFGACIYHFPKKVYVLLMTNKLSLLSNDFRKINDNRLLHE